MKYTKQLIQNKIQDHQEHINLLEEKMQELSIQRANYEAKIKGLQNELNDLHSTLSILKQS